MAGIIFLIYAVLCILKSRRIFTIGYFLLLGIGLLTNKNKIISTTAILAGFYSMLSYSKTISFQSLPNVLQSMADGLLAFLFLTKKRTLIMRIAVCIIYYLANLTNALSLGLKLDLFITCLMLPVICLPYIFIAFSVGDDVSNKISNKE
ncbi:MAG: hypothetical protein KBT46_02825 [Ruminococcus sp.]|nr:hypothetical protein [Candidatus Copronaster equi]